MNEKELIETINKRIDDVHKRLDDVQHQLLDIKKDIQNMKFETGKTAGIIALLLTLFVILAQNFVNWFLK